MIWIYNILIHILAPIWVPWVWLKSRRRKEAPNWKERFGDYSLPLDKSRPSIWVHSVSVGEVIAAVPVLRSIKKQRPDIQVVLSTTTSTGHETAIKLDGAFDHLVYFPIDVARFMWVATWRVRPQVVAVFETELWLNFLHFAKQAGATNLLVNGRISDRSFRRSRWVMFYYQTLVEKLDRCLMQTEADAERIRTYGAKNVEVFGNTKFDENLSANPEARQYWRNQVSASDDDVVIVAGSTRGEAEEAFLLEALSGLPSVKVIHAPRHIEGVDGLIDRVTKARGVPAQRSRNQTGPYLILDTYGELGQAYSAADIAIVGGGFLPLGGQNIIQPMACGVAVLHGPNMQNFRDVAALAETAGASLSCRTPADLREKISLLISDPDLRREMGRKGHDLVESNRGASDRYAQAILSAVDAT
ncbi:MAG: 3-deoxy-D-manno-octulosonic acid transferase [Chthonomonas sp.]|nr:3-deoxy-D-manno-octulosonic acid transferase [Chthonomonas sp.]